MRDKDTTALETLPESQYDRTRPKQKNVTALPLNMLCSKHTHKNTAFTPCKMYTDRAQSGMHP